MTDDLGRDPNILTVSEAARFMRCSRQTLYTMLGDKSSAFGEYVSVYIGARRRISKVRLERWLHGERVAS